MSRAYSRRHFLRSAGLGAAALTPGAMLAEALLTDAFRSASAEAGGTPIQRNYVNLNMGGGPPRYLFDHWLKTQDDEPEVLESAYNATALTYDGRGEVDGTEHKLHRYKEYLVPNIFWTFSPEERATFLDSFLVIRGYGTGIDGHGLNSQLQLHPLASAASITGVIADHSERPFQSLRYPSSRRRFQSDRGFAINQVDGINPLNVLLDSLNSTSRTRDLIDGDYASAFRDARAALAGLDAKSDAVRLARKNLDRGHALLQSNLGDFAAEWESLVAKYDAIALTAARSMNVPGVSVSHDGATSLSMTVRSDDGRFDSGVGSVGFIRENTNLCLITEFARVGIGRRLALAEFCIRNKLVSGFEFALGNTEDLNASPGLGLDAFGLGNDMHGGGGYVAFMAMNAYHRATVAALLAFRAALVESGDWSNTVVHLTSEFDRVISFRGTGSGHGTEQMISSIFSGVFEGGPYVVGNIWTWPEENASGPSQGQALPIEGYNVSHRPTPIMMASTVSELLGVETNPWRNFQAPLIELRSDRTLGLPFGRGRMSIQEAR